MVIRSNYSVSNVVTELIIKVIFEVIDEIANTFKAALKIAFIINKPSDNKILRVSK